ncbi:MAG: hypothetical protein C0420_11625 [Methylobacterium sp.]|nr:hypothetical protein [Methylobacterium sp.]
MGAVEAAVSIHRHDGNGGGLGPGLGRGRILRLDRWKLRRDAGIVGAGERRRALAGLAAADIGRVDQAGLLRTRGRVGGARRRRRRCGGGGWHARGGSRSLGRGLRSGRGRLGPGRRRGGRRGLCRRCAGRGRRLALLRRFGLGRRGGRGRDHRGGRGRLAGRLERGGPLGRLWREARRARPGLVARIGPGDARRRARRGLEDDLVENLPAIGVEDQPDAGARAGAAIDDIGRARRDGAVDAREAIVTRRDAAQSALRNRRRGARGEVAIAIAEALLEIGRVVIEIVLGRCGAGRAGEGTGDGHPHQRAAPRRGRSNGHGEHPFPRTY